MRASAAPAILSASLIATAAFAQEAPQAADAPAEGDTIIVTGSLIKNPNLVSSSPVTAIGENEMQLRQTTNAETLLRDIPGVVPSLGQNVNNGNGGAAFVDLRGLGYNRNIVLLDGKRVAPADFNGAFDLNNIPTALISRVDVLTGGASTTYGADAVSGVVNFITRNDFAGMDLSIGEQITDQGDGNRFNVDFTVGANFDDGRGNAVLSVGYQEVDPIYQGDRDISIFGISSTTGRGSGSSFTSTPTGISFPTEDTQVGPDGSSLVPFYQGFNFNPYNIFVTPFKRFNIFGSTRYEVSDKVEVFSRALFSKNTVDTIIAPSGIFGTPLSIPGNNPYLPTAIRDRLCNEAGITLGEACNTNGAIPMPAVYRRTVEIGPRISSYETQIFDINIGTRYHINDSLSLEVYGSHGESQNTQTQSGYVLNSRVQQALNATNTTSCIDTSNSCVPLNLFGTISGDQAAFLNGQSTITNKTALSQAHAMVSGDFGVTSPMASNPVSFAAGAEYRNYTAQRIPDNLSLVPGELGGAGGAVLPLDGGYDVYEFFGEVIAPLVSDRPFFQELTVEGGVRYSKYKVDAAGSPRFNATTYKFGATWAPIDDVKIRGNYQRAVRAPNIGELFAPVSTGLTNLSVDPCAGAAPTLDANLAAVCLAQGAPAASIGSIQNPSADQANATGGGNPNIRPETAKTFTAGIVLQPRNLVSGLTITVDYYNIKISNAITAATPADIIGACFGNITAASATDEACTSIRRNPANGRLSGTSTPEVPINGLPQPLTNNGRLATDGIDLSINYQTDLNFAKLALGFNGNWTHKSTFQAAATSYNRDCVGYYSINCASIQPEFSFTQRTTLSFDKIDVSLLWRYIDSVEYEGQASDYLARGFTAGNRNLFNGEVTGAGPLVGKSYNFNKINAYSYFDLTTRFAVTDNIDLTMSAFNIFDKKPPVVGSAAGTTTYNSGNTFPSTYDAVGRRFAATARLKF
ncbi:TonB-dependent Receptor Plug Domain [Sphingobium sp. YR768]|nr:TonB-dependent Receptor Plug Domain [Sphingobium sp. YR768]